MSQRARIVFVSGTRRDLGAFYPAAKAAIDELPGYRAQLMEDGHPEDIPPVRWSRRAASNPDLFVGLIGHYRGTVPAGASSSITEQEYDTAKRVGIDRLMFLTDASDPAIVAGQNPTAVEPIRVFRGRIAADVVYAKVVGPDDFAKRVVAAIRAWESRTVAGATTDVEDYFRAWLEGDKDFGHQDALAGQATVLERIGAFAESSARILLVHGPWGRGKSRVLLEWARRATLPVRFIRQEAEFTRQAIAISCVDHCILVLEDAQKKDPDDLRSLLAFLQRCSGEVKLLVASRTSHVGEFQTHVRGAGFSEGEESTVEVTALTDPEHRELVVGILGRDCEEAAIIAARTRGNALAGVVAARLFRRGKLNLASIERSDEFVKVVLQTFRDALLQVVPGGAAERHRDVLKLVAIAGPVRPGDLAEMGALATFLGWKVERFGEALSDLEDAGLLLRIGGLLRIPVDAVAESELLDACVNKHGESLGYAERALRELWPAFATNLLRNLAIAEWDAKTIGRPLNILFPVWRDLAERYAVLPASERLDMLRMLENVSGLQPASVLKFVRDAIASGLGPEESEAVLRGRFQLREIQDGLARLLVGPLLYPEHVQEACDLLWMFAEDDTRPPNQHPESPERLLREAAEYGLRKQRAVNEAFLDWAARRSIGAGAVPAYRLAAYLSPFLEKEGEHQWSEEWKLSMLSFAISYEKVRAIRERALSLLQTIAESDDAKSAAAAIETMGRALSPPRGTFGRQVTTEEIAKWFPEELATIGRLREIRDRGGRRSIDLCILSTLLWVERHSPNPELKAEAAKFISEIRITLDGSIAVALMPEHKLFFVSAREEEHEGHILAICTVAKTLVESEKSALALFARVSVVAQELKIVGVNPDGWFLLMEIARLRPDFGEAVVSALLPDPSHVLLPALGGLLNGLFESEPVRARASVEEIISSRSASALRVLAQNYMRPQWTTLLGKDVVLRHLSFLLDHDDSSVRVGALRAVAMMKTLEPRERLDLLLAYDLAGAPETGDEWAGAFEHEALYRLCTDAEIVVILDKLCVATTLDYTNEKLFDYLCHVAPAGVVDMLLARVRRAGALPRLIDHPEHDSGNPFRNLPVAERERALAALGVLLGDQNYRVVWAANGFMTTLSVAEKTPIRELRRSWVQSAEPKLVVRAAESMRREAPGFLLSEEALIVEVLRAAGTCSADCLRTVESDIALIAYNGIRMTDPGEPDPVDVALRDEGRTIAAKYEVGSKEATFYGVLANAAESRLKASRREEQENSL